jgi:lipopolysaccharide transport system ATP-binding protein
MTAPPIIAFQDVWKGFHRHTGRLLLRSHLKNVLGAHRQTEKFYALRGVTFQMERGECLAVVGANGAGKSTLLNLVAGLAPPERGVVSVDGRVAALLELGSGFHPDLTGSENVRLNAALLGTGRKQMESVYGEIVDFAELSDFMDEPLRTYSSGMVMRLAFAVAVSVDPDVLLIDEVLAVGDRAFQTKCFERIMHFRERGKSILCVSHASGMVQELCERAIWLAHGDLVLDGPIGEVCDAYEGRVRANSSQS